MMKTQKIRYPLENHVIFAKVMGNQPVCQEFIQRLFTDRNVTGVKDLEVTDITTEATIIPGVYSKSVRFDVLFGDDMALYNIEMQVAREEDLPRRGRYYSAALDIANLEKGKHYEKLRQSFIIFVCRFDYFGKGEAIYTFERYDKKSQTSYLDGSYIILLNTRCPEEKVPQELRSLFRYINTEEVADGDEFVEMIHELVVSYQSDKEVLQIMTLEEEYIRKAEIAIEYAEEEARAEGRADERARLNKLNDMLLADNRLDDLKKSFNDKTFQQRLLEEFGLDE